MSIRMYVCLMLKFREFTFWSCGDFRVFSRGWDTTLQNSQSHLKWQCILLSLEILTICVTLINIYKKKDKGPLKLIQ